MSEETKKIEKKDEQATELSEQDLDNVAGGAAYSTTRSNTAGGESAGTVSGPSTPTGAVTVTPSGGSASGLH